MFENWSIIGVFQEETQKLYCVVDFLLENYFPDLNSENFDIKLEDETLCFVNLNNFSCRVNIEKKAIIFHEFEVNSDKLEEIIFKFQIDPIQNIEFDLNLTKKFFPSLTVKENKLQLTIVIVFSLNIEANNLPKSIPIEKTSLDVFNAPNLDLINDWLFCHNHSADTSIKIPENVSKLILTNIEQIYYLLDNESQQILFESVEEKDESIYLNLIQR